MNAQDLFDVVVTHLYTQGRRAMDGVSCRYRAADGAACAVGCLLEDAEVHPAMEGVGLTSDFDEILLPPRLRPHIELLAQLQGDHDTTWLPESFNEQSARSIEERLRDTAERNGLQYREEHYPTPPITWK